MTRKTLLAGALRARVERARGRLDGRERSRGAAGGALSPGTDRCKE